LNPLDENGSDDNIAIRIIKGRSQQIEYKYLGGNNITTLKLKGD
jgi:hypothetical protein